MNQYILIGTYPNRNKQAFVVMADNYSKAIQKLLSEEKDNFINIEVVDTYGSLTAIGGATLMSNKDTAYQNVADAMQLIYRIMCEYEIEETLDELGEPTDAFHSRFDHYVNSLEKESADALLTLLGMAKTMIGLFEKAGHDCL